ncbi:MAG: hypothetical protein ABWX94_02300, partial [Candidatus Saccharimonadales bacterium]
IGALQSWKTQRGTGILFGSFVISGVILAVGTAGTPFVYINTFLFDHVPFFDSFREPQKFVMLIVIGFAYFGAQGIVWIRTRTGIGDNAKKTLSLIVCIIPAGLAPLLPGAGHGQLHSQPYPRDWYHVREIMSREAPNSVTLILPWHLYMPYHFSNGTIANPAPKFFSTKTISSQDPELDGATGYTNDSIGQKIPAILATASDDLDFTSKLSGLTITHVILTKDFDYKKYDYLSEKKGMEKFIVTNTLTVYKITSK